ncbi:hypothetical protein MKW92_035129 [Papaver armeniacum]|nr:hypothetical protein MKW92_035129 [Papaver armeniacum]
MAKFIMFLSFFLFVLIAMPTSSSSIKDDTRGGMITKCPKPDCSLIQCVPFSCVQVVLKCPNGQYSPCCSCPKCCPV